MNFDVTLEITNRLKDLVLFDDSSVDFICLCKEFINRDEIDKAEYFFDMNKFEPGIYYFILVRDKNRKEFTFVIKQSSKNLELNELKFGDKLFIHVPQ